MRIQADRNNPNPGPGDYLTVHCPAILVPLLLALLRLFGFGNYSVYLD